VGDGGELGAYLEAVIGFAICAFYKGLGFIIWFIIWRPAKIIRVSV
jgi:hypothetical protein